MEQPKDNPDDLLDRALGAMRREPSLGEFPADRVLQHLAASRDAARQQHQLPVRSRRKTMKLALKLAAAAAVAFVMIAGLLFSHDRRALAFADVARQVDAARTMTLDLIASPPGQPVEQARAMFRGPGQWRFEHGDRVAIADGPAGVSVILDQTQKTALVLHVRPEGGASTRPAGPDSDWLATLKRLARTDGKPVGEKEIDGAKARGFEVTDQGQRYVVWADVQAGAPVRVEMLPPGDANGPPMVTLDHIKLEVPLADDLFSTSIPPGYTKQEANLDISAREPTEPDLIDFLRAYAKANGGRFPNGFGLRESPQVVASMVPAEQRKADKVTPEILQVSMLFGRATAFLSKIKGNWGYAGDATTLRDADKPLFWYRAEGATQYRAIYGDLHTGEAEAVNLPPATHTAADLMLPPPLAPQQQQQPAKP